VPNDVIDTICPHINAAQTHERDASFLRQSLTPMQHSILSMNRVNHRLIETRTQDMREREPHSLSLLLAASPSLASPPSVPRAIISLLAIECVWTTTILDLVAVEYRCTFDLI